jgi:hypothetical protein
LATFWNFLGSFSRHLSPIAPACALLFSRRRTWASGSRWRSSFLGSWRSVNRILSREQRIVAGFNHEARISSDGENYISSDDFHFSEATTNWFPPTPP